MQITPTPAMSPTMFTQQGQRIVQWTDSQSCSGGVDLLSVNRPIPVRRARAIGGRFAIKWAGKIKNLRVIWGFMLGSILGIKLRNM